MIASAAAAARWRYRTGGARRRRRRRDAGLVELTHQDGSGRPIELGTYIGIRKAGQLIAMAGERL
jgi:hypothetical protein